MRSILLPVFSLLLIFACHTPKTTSPNKNILVVLAHPDDEMAFGSMLARYAREGYRVQLLIAVNAAYDTRFVAASPDSLALIKQEEARCSAEKLGILPLVFLNLNSLDRKHGEKDGVRAAVEAGSLLREKLKELIEKTKPDAIISFGPDGEYGHPEHIIVSSLVTELLLREAWVEKYPLYYFGWTRSQEANRDGWVRFVDDSYFNVVINYTNEDEAKAMESLQCYKSGFSQQEISETIQFEKQRKNELYFRRFAVAKGMQEGF